MRSRPGCIDELVIGIVSQGHDCFASALSELLGSYPNQPAACSSCSPLSCLAKQKQTGTEHANQQRNPQDADIEVERAARLPE